MLDCLTYLFHTMILSGIIFIVPNVNYLSYLVRVNSLFLFAQLQLKLHPVNT